MAKINFTAGRVSDHRCELGKSQSFLWDSTAPGLGVRATAKYAECKKTDRDNGNAYIFQAKLKGQAIRITVGLTANWTIQEAQAEARRLKVIIDNGEDPRQVKADALAVKQDARNAKQAEQVAKQAKQLSESVTLSIAWKEYVEERTPLWSKHHITDHARMMHVGGKPCIGKLKLTGPGPLAPLAELRLIDLTNARVEAWARVEAVTRPTRARLAMRLLKACLNWCAAHPDYAAVTITNAAKSKKARESLGKPSKKVDALEREQLKAWFDAVRQIGNPVVSSYLQCLLLTGARREEIAALKWDDVDFRWKKMKLNDKIEDFRMVPLTPYVSHLLASLPRRNEWVFSSLGASSGHIASPRLAHNEAVAIAGLPHLTLQGLRRSFATLCEWIETPGGISAQIQGHAPQGVREQNYIRRPLDLLRLWHCRIEGWMLGQAGVEFLPANEVQEL
ncbi:MAG: tyrosine-type recombinase/integrase [Glaciimonas sp.]|nr:tyrosine-type recombinase/integrase [Glaciimonas sp.]